MSILKEALAGKLTKRTDDTCETFDGFLKSFKVTEASGVVGGDQAFFDGVICLGVLCTDGTILVNEHACSAMEAARRYQEIKSRMEEQRRWDQRASYVTPLQKISRSSELPASVSGGSKSTADPRNVQASLIL